jgi:hypothetical protein
MIPNPKVHRPLLILRLTSDCWLAHFPNTRAQLVLGDRKLSLKQVVDKVRERWPNTRIAVDEIILEDETS